MDYSFYWVIFNLIYETSKNIETFKRTFFIDGRWNVNRQGSQVPRPKNRTARFSKCLLEFSYVKEFCFTEFIWFCLLTLTISKRRDYTHCGKFVQIWSYFWSVFSCIQSEYRKIRTRKNSVFGHFSRSV